MITKIAFVGHPVKDMDAAKHFYGELLGLKCSANHGDKWVEFDTPDGKSIALDTFSSQHAPETTVYLSLESDNIEAELSALREQGVKIVKDVQDNKVCKMAWVEDPDGNVLMLHQIAPDRVGKSGEPVVCSED